MLAVVTEGMGMIGEVTATFCLFWCWLLLLVSSTWVWSLLVLMLVLAWLSSCVGTDGI